jgi:bifunctional DNA-binding transcriptional regulator/antitoxin component of YhaV-PrlF toxin-antitoxin module
MSKVTRKLQISVPKVLADRYGIAPGDDLAWEAAGDGLRLLTKRESQARLSKHERLRLFDAATERQRKREREQPIPPSSSRGWTRDDLYERRARPR